MKANEKIERLEEEHEQLGDTAPIRAQRAEIKEKIRKLDQEIGQFSVRLFSISIYHCLKRVPVGAPSLG